MLQLRSLFGSGKASRTAQTQGTGVAPGATAAADEAPDEAELIARGKALFAQGRLADALALVDGALARFPGNATLHFAQGATLFAWGRFREAREGYERAQAAGLDDIDLDLHLGWVCLNLQRIDEAEAHFRKAVARDPESEQACVALANVLETRGALAGEAAEFTRDLARWPRNYEGQLLLAACRFYLNDREGGIATFRAAAELDPGRSRAWANLGVALSDDGRFDEALEALRRAHAIDVANGSAESLVNYATVLREDGRIGESLRVIEERLAAHPDPRAHWLRSMLLLELGRYREAWPQHEFRWMKEPLADRRRAFLGPVWGGQDLKGKTILLHAEQGLGDAIQFVRFARPLKERGARVVFDSFRDLGELAHDFRDIDEVASDGALPAFDFRVPLLSIPRVLGTTLDSVPGHVPYVDVRPEYRERWARRIDPDERLKVGLVWSGNLKHPRNRYRSVALTRLASLWQVDGVRMYSLQKSATAEDEIATSGLDIIDLGKDFTSFRDTAAAISLLDLVISVDTSVAHLAGALGHPIWVLVGEPPDWRWLIEGDTTPWYPSARIFRQARRDAWDPVVDKLHTALRERAASVSDRRAQPDPVRLRAASMCEASVREAPGREVSGREFRARDMGQAALLDVGTPKFCGVDEARNGIIQTLPSTELAASLACYGEYRQAELDLLGRFVKPGGWVIEQGCGAGAATLFFARAVGESGHVLAFEPDRLLNQIARQNLTANRFRNVTLLMQGLGGPTPAKCTADGSGSGGSRSDTIDGLHVARLDWIRINSGATASAILGGATETLWRLRPWVFAVTNDEAEENAAIAVLRDHAYQWRRFRAPLFDPGNYNRRGDDIFSGRIASGLFCVPEEVEIDTDLEGCTPIS